MPTNDPNPRSPPQTVSETNATPTSSVGSWDRTLVESVADAEKKRQMQAPNRSSIWSRSQMPREKAMQGPRFEQMIVEDQVRFIGSVAEYKKADLLINTATTIRGD
jgi:NADH dehydrogenase (ubiquinone) Fe-S protein 6